MLLKVSAGVYATVHGTSWGLPHPLPPIPLPHHPGIAPLAPNGARTPVLRTVVPPTPSPAPPATDTPPSSPRRHQSYRSRTSLPCPGHEINDPGLREGVEMLVVGRLPDREVLLCRLKDRPRRHISPIAGSFRDPAGECPLGIREPRNTGPERRPAVPVMRAAIQAQF